MLDRVAAECAMRHYISNVFEIFLTEATRETKNFKYKNISCIYANLFLNFHQLDRI